MELKHAKITQYIPAIFLACYVLINVKSKHEERLIFDRLSVRVFFRLLNIPKSR